MDRFIVMHRIVSKYLQNDTNKCIKLYILHIDIILHNIGEEENKIHRNNICVRVFILYNFFLEFIYYSI